MSDQQSINPNAPAQVAELRDDEIDLGALLAKLWARKWLILGISLLVPLLVLAFHLNKKSLYIPHGYKLPLMFSFAGAQKGQYPNGERFIVDDLVNSEVLLAAARETGAPEDVLKATDIRPGNGLTDAVEQQFIEQLQVGKRITDSQLQSLNEALTRAGALARQYAVLSVNRAKTTANPDQIAAYLAAIPRIWSERAVNEMGVLEVKHQVASQPFVFDGKASLIKEFFRFQGYLGLLHRSINELGDYGLANLSGLRGGDSRRLSEVRLTLDSLRTEFNDLLAMVPYAIDGKRDSADRVSESLLAAKRLNLELERSKLEKMVKVYDDSLNLLGNGRERLASNEQLKSAQSAYAAGVYSPQLSDQMFGSLLQLGKELSDSEQRALIIKKRIAAAEQIQDVDLQLARLSGSSAVNYQLLDEAHILALLDQQIATANQVQADIQGISTLVSKQVLGTSSVLSEPLGPVFETAANSVTLKRFVLQMVLALVSGGIVALFLALVLPTKNER